MNNDVSAVAVTVVLSLVTFAWISLGAKLLRNEPLVAFEPRRETPWGLITVVLSFFLLLGAQAYVGLSLRGDLTAEPTVSQTNELLKWTAIATLIATGCSIGLIHLFLRAAWQDLGISLKHILQDVVTGVHAFLILGPLTFLIQFVFVKIFEIESHHPLIELLKEDSSGGLFGVVLILAVVVAPISEEYFFRILLQGWLEKHFLFGLSSNDTIHDEIPETEPNCDVAREGDVGTAPESESRRILTTLPTGVIERTFAVGSVPILISAAVFALMHWSHGPDPIALFVLALGLGYLYQRTHRWLPCIVTHACLNGTTMLILWLSLDELGA